MATFFYRKVVILKQRRSDGARAVPNERADSNDGAFRALWGSDEGRIREMKAACEAVGVQLIVLHWPQPRMEKWNGIVAEGMSRLSRETGLVGLKDLPEKFESYSLEELVVANDGHPSALAHRLVGEYLAAEIQSRIRKREPAETKLKPPTL